MTPLLTKVIKINNLLKLAKNIRKKINNEVRLIPIIDGGKVRSLGL